MISANTRWPFASPDMAQTLSPLAASAVYTQASVAVESPVNVYAQAMSDQAGTVQIECSNDNTHWYPVGASATLAAGSSVLAQELVLGGYYRVVLTNGATAQTQVALSVLALEL